MHTTRYYHQLTPSEKEIRMNIHLQVLAVHNPKRIIVPPNFIPRTQVDKWIAMLLERHEKEK